MDFPSQPGQRALDDTPSDNMHTEPTQAPGVEMQVVDDDAVSAMAGVEQIDSIAQSSEIPRPPLPANAAPLPSVEQLPPSPQIGVRRGRVEDDHDDERDRRHPSQRVGNPLPSDSSDPPSSRPSQTSLPGIFQLFSGYPSIIPRGPSSSSESNAFSLPSLPSSASMSAPPAASFEQPASASQSTSTSIPAAPLSSAQSDTLSRDTSPRPPNNRPTGPPEFVGGFAITFDRFGNMHTMPLPITGPRRSTNDNLENNNATIPPHPSDTPQVADNAGQVPESQNAPEHTTQEDNPAAHFAEWLTGMAFLAGLTGFPMAMDREAEDPERAKKLVAGLEDVPIGLVRRLERIGGTGGGMGEGLSSGGDSGCAICWDKLLNDVEEDGEEAKEEDHDAESSPSSSGKEKKYPRIVSLPCAHVFHADCLVPWFSRPKQTTCPTCRFNIDPENLTYSSQAQRRRAAQAQANREEEPPTAEENATHPSNANIPPPHPGVVGIDIPLFTAPFPPFIPNRPNPSPSVPDADRASGAQPDTHQAENTPEREQTMERNAEETTGRNPPENANRARRPVEIFTIGLDIHINRGPLPPFPPVVTPAQPAPQPEQRNPPSGAPREPVVPLVSGIGRSLGEVMQQVVGSLFHRGAPGTAPASQNTPAPSEEEGANRNAPVFFGPIPPPPSEPAPVQAPSSNGEANAAPTHAADAQPQAQRQRNPPTAHIILEGAPVLDILSLLMRSPPPPRPDNNARGSGAPSAAAPKQQWVPPPAPGPTLRQRIEKKEQEAGLRCCDVSCGVGPSDEDPWVDVTEKGMRQLSIRACWHDAEHSVVTTEEKHTERKPVCPHTFHSSCLVSAERVSIALRDGHVEYVGPENEEVEVSCPICRGVGTVSKEEWNEGLKALD